DQSLSAPGHAFLGKTGEATTILTPGVGCGLYEWQFSTESGLVERLTITIEHMKTLPASDVHCIMKWVSHLDYPWCHPEALANNSPDIETLEEVIQYVTADSAI
ncbi:hypothetical protein A260_21408, partial [Pseudomonas syringae pv. actinidiae ICMP 19068]